MAKNAILMERKSLNRVKIVLLEQRKTSKWLSSKLKKDISTVSRWCTNDTQPSLETLAEIAELLNVGIHDLIQNTK